LRTSRIDGKLILAVALLAATLASSATAGTTRQASLDTQLRLALKATSKYAAGLAVARHDGYRTVAGYVPGVGLEVMNPSVKGFDVRKPAVLIYEHRGSSWRLGAVEWVFPDKPARPPLAGARYGNAGSGLVGMRVWLWAANPNGLFASTNPAASYASPLVPGYGTD
jgi:hypothetical protein